MIDLEQARQLAADFVADLERRGGIPLALLDAHTRTLPYGWLFFYQSRDPVEFVAGNAPILITRSGELHVTGTAYPVETYLREFERSGSPHPPPAGVPVQVRVTGWRAGLRKVAMTQTIREQAGIGLGAAKSLTDRVLEGGAVALPAPDWPAAVRLAEALQELGAEARPERVPPRVG